MKAVKILILAGLLAHNPLYAEQSKTTERSMAIPDSIETSRICTPRTLLCYQYDRLSSGDDEIESQNLHGFAIEKLAIFSVSKSFPIFIETGIGANIGWGKSSFDRIFEISGIKATEGKVKQQLTAISLTIPVNVSYKVNINKSLALQPFLGLNLKFNLFGQQKTKIEVADKTIQKEVEKWNVGDYAENLGIARTRDMFDKIDTDKDERWRRFQLGWHIGVELTTKDVNFGISYGTDFIKLAEKINSSTLKVSLGFNF